MIRTKDITDKAITGLCCIVFFLAFAPVFAEPVETVKTEYYEVHGADMKEVRRSMDQHSRMTHNFGNRDALTDYKINTKWGNPPVVMLDVTYIMPKWVECSQAPKGLQEKWQNYVKGVQFHEDGHRKIAEDCARAVEQRMVSEGPRPSNKLNHDIRIIYTEYNRKQLEYDRITKHGQNQGINFPY
jgi:predicted secreted Zn-dependent protease